MAEETIIATAREQSLRVRLIPFIDRFGIIFVVLGMMAILTYLEPNVFLTWRNLTNVTRQVAVNAFLALGQFLVILTAGIDLSVGSILALSMMSLAVASAAGWPWWITIWIPALVGLAVGLVNGVGLTKLRLISGA